jgi:peptidyl-tRNA hydrolase
MKSNISLIKSIHFTVINTNGKYKETKHNMGIWFLIGQDLDAFVVDLTTWLSDKF